MLSIFVYLYNSFSDPHEFPDDLTLARQLEEVGFDHQQIVSALTWIADFQEINQDLRTPIAEPASTSSRCFTSQEQSLLGCELLSQIEGLVQLGVLSIWQRESIIEQAFAVGEHPLSEESFRVLLLLVLWFNRQPDGIAHVVNLAEFADRLRVLH